jgi:endoglucanase
MGPGRRVGSMLGVVATLAQVGCDEDFTCGLRLDDPAAALIVGLVCSGRHAPQDGEPPTAGFTMTPNPVVSGHTVRFDASASSDPDKDIVRYEWEIDGVGGEDAFEVGSEQPVLEQRVLASSRSSRGRTIWLRVIDSADRADQQSAVLRFNAPGVLAAAFSIDPSPAVVGQEVTFDASASSGAVDYSWVLDRDGAFTAPTSRSTVSHTYATPGERIVRLMVRDALGGAVETSKVLNVRSAAAGADVSAVARAAVRRRVQRAGQGGG